MSEPFDSEIKALEAHAQELVRNLDAARMDFVGASARALEDFWPEFVGDTVSENGPRLEQMSQKQVAGLKSAVAKITADPDGVAKDVLLDQFSEIWKHEIPVADLIERKRKGPGGSLFSDFHRFGSPPVPLDGPIQAAAGAPAVPFSNAGLRSKTNRSGQGAVLSYRFPWTDQMFAIAESYAAHGHELESTCRQICELERKREQSDARNIWDRA